MSAAGQASLQPRMHPSRSAAGPGLASAEEVLAAGVGALPTEASLRLRRRQPLSAAGRASLWPKKRRP